MRRNKAIHYLRTNFDTVGLVGLLASASFAPSAAALSDEEHAVLAALRRSNEELATAPLEDVQAYLQGLDADQVPGLVSNVKGILHEMEFVKVENGDGDSVYASYFDATNHPDTDIQLVDETTGAAWEVQLKATESTSHVNDWIEAHPGGEILVTEELAERMDLPSSGQSNEELTVRTEDFVDRMVAMDSSGDPSIWQGLPVLGLASAALVVSELWKRHRRGEMDYPTFKRLAAVATGLKLAYIGIMGVVLSIPVVGQVTGALLIAKLLVSAKSTWIDRKWPTPPVGRPTLAAP